MNRLLRAATGLSFSQWLALISLLVLLNLIIMGGLLWVIVADISPQQLIFSQSVLAQAPATRTPNPTFTVTSPLPTMTPFPSATSTTLPTWTPSITYTPLPTNTPTKTPIPTATSRVLLARAVRPAATSTPAPTPTPNVDFAASVRQLTPCENQGKHHLFISVVDESGNGIPGVRARVSWVGGEAFVETGTKIEDPGLTDFAMFKGSYSVELVGLLSDKAGPVTPDIPQDQTCHENGNPVGNSLFHYSYDITFKKVR